jgi:hypothetical protein
MAGLDSVENKIHLATLMRSPFATGRTEFGPSAVAADRALQNDAGYLIITFLTKAAFSPMAARTWILIDLKMRWARLGMRGDSACWVRRNLSL